MTTTTTDYRQLLADAHAAGLAAMEATRPTPMVVYEADGLSDEPKPGGQAWYVPEGPCGFAWVTIRPATTPFARWLKANRFDVDRWVNEAEGGRWSKAYGGGYQFWVWVGGQSVELKAAYARAYAETLREAGVEAYSASRLD